MNKFDTATSAAAALVANKKPDCVTALNTLFYQFIEEGLTPREAYYKADVTHILRDHEGSNHGSLHIEETDEAVHQEIINVLMESNEDGLAESRIDAVITWYDLVRSWGAPVVFAYAVGTVAGQEAWEDEHDMDEADAINKLQAIETADADDEALKDTTIKTFYALRNEGNSVRASLREAIEQAQQALELRLLFAMLSAGSNDEDGADALGAIFGRGLLN